MMKKQLLVKMIDLLYSGYFFNLHTIFKLIISRESICFWKGNSGIHHSNGVIIVQKNLQDLDIISYLCQITESIKFPATGLIYQLNCQSKNI